MSVKLSEYGFNGIILETQTACNMKCTFCPQPLIKDKTVEMPEDIVYKVIGELNPDDIPLVHLHGFNEPLLDPRIYGFISYVKVAGLQVQIATNGLLLMSDVVRKKLLDAEPTHIRISMQTLNEPLFQNTRGVCQPYQHYRSGIFQFLAEAVERNTKSKIVIDVGCNLNIPGGTFLKWMLGVEYGDPCMPNTKEAILDDVDTFVLELNKFHPEFEYDRNEIVCHLVEANYNYTEQSGIRLARNITLKVKPFFYGRRLSDFYPAINSDGCRTDILKVNADGMVSPCCLMYDDMITMGNVNDSSLEEILKSNKFLMERIRTGAGFPEICRRCKGSPTMRGVVVMAAHQWYKRRGEK